MQNNPNRGTDGRYTDKPFYQKGEFWAFVIAVATGAGGLFVGSATADPICPPAPTEIGGN